MKEVNAEVTVTMTSREIAELTGKRHRHVVRDIEVMFEQLGGSCEGYAQIWAHPQNGQEYRGYSLDREHTECLITGYSAELRMKVIRRVRELEKRITLEHADNQPRNAQPAAFDMRNLPPALLRQMADLIEENAELKTSSAKPTRKYTRRSAAAVASAAPVKTSRLDPVLVEGVRTMLSTYPGTAVLLGGFIDRLRHRAPFKKAGKPARAAELRKLIDGMVEEGMLVKCWDGRGVVIR